MELIKVEDLNFTYPGGNTAALAEINISINSGEFVTVCGQSGCGKTTLLRLLKPALSPVGELCGGIYFGGKSLADIDARGQAADIGFVMQNPETQIVCDKVWHELAFGAENLGLPNSEIRARVAEMAAFFGIEEWFRSKTCDLSGGQKQLLNLASVMVMQPSVLILDEPTSQLDPIAAREFLETLKRLNLELGTTIIISEHRLEEVVPLSDRIVVLDEGRIICNGCPQEVVRQLTDIGHIMAKALPVPMRVFSALERSGEVPLTVRDGRLWMERFVQSNPIFPERIPKVQPLRKGDVAVTVKDAWFRYGRELPDILRGLNLEVFKGEIFALMGGNGAGKSTVLSLISGVNTPYSGKILINGVPLKKIPKLYDGVLGVLPQSPECLFVKNTVRLDLEDMIQGKDGEKEIEDISRLCRIQGLLDRHPSDLSGGERQRAALAKVLLKKPERLLLDEPTKGMDSNFKDEFAEILRSLTADGVTILLVSHDIEFCAKYADRCALMFDGEIISVARPREFFAGKSFYTTSANRMARSQVPAAVLAEDIILACGGKEKKL
ncbi:MAG: energy-coupling factor ABC transporter ATP-binding protein [Ruminococcaceae bacterium]|nr:energy-coupling factor ABC transporter ATP-binding protein [Oscillospiraceae bacterium]